jgi:galactose mutarotase-like enzyme
MAPPRTEALLESASSPVGEPSRTIPLSRRRAGGESSGLDRQLGELDFDDGFALMAEQASFSVAGAARRITVEFLAGYLYAQVYAPKDKDYIAVEPMTAPTSAHTSGRGLRLVKPGGQFRAVLRIRIDAHQVMATVKDVQGSMFKVQGFLRVSTLNLEL